MPNMNDMEEHKKYRDGYLVKITQAGNDYYYLTSNLGGDATKNIMESNTMTLAWVGRIPMNASQDEWDERRFVEKIEVKRVPHDTYQQLLSALFEEI